jgi:hypothetical protein
MIKRIRHGARSLGRFFSTQRPLADHERAFLFEYFGDSIPLERVRLAGGGHPGFAAHEHSVGRAWQPLGSTIQLPDGYYEEDDPRAPVREGQMGVLAHEALHVWQRCRGRAVSLRGIAEPILHRDPYDWRALDSEDPSVLFENFRRARIEQQARMFETYVVEARGGEGEVAKWAEVARYVKAPNRR